MIQQQRGGGTLQGEFRNLLTTHGPLRLYKGLVRQLPQSII